MARSNEKHFFEKGLERLEEITCLLDAPEVPLEEALRLYEEGTRLRARLAAYLEEAERRVAILESGGGEDDETHQDAPEAPPQKAKARRHGKADEIEGGLFS